MTTTDDHTVLIDRSSTAVADPIYCYYYYYTVPTLRFLG